jgi:phenylpyruvate tautomerase PptA (4-oxalocrotonate tautomerase family)
MPYLRLTCPPVETAVRREIAGALTEALVALFTPPRGPDAAEIRTHTTVHFTPYGPDELFIGAAAPDLKHPDVTAELSDWSMSTRQQRRVAAQLTPLLARLFATEPDAVNLRFHSYPPTDFAVGGKLLSQRVPRAIRMIKRLLG